MEYGDGGPDGWRTALLAAGAVGAGWAVDALRRRRAARLLHRRTVDLLLNVLNAGDAVTERHCRRVADLSYALAEAAGLGGGALRTLRVAALLHDMGKIDDRYFEIVHSRRRLTPTERTRIRGHPHESAHILAPLEEDFPGLREIVGSHHEAWDGSGYPRGLGGEAIPFGARVVAIADAFDAMTQPRKYRPPVPVGAALAELRAGAGAQFDPALVTLASTRRVRREWKQIARRDLFSEPEETAPRRVRAPSDGR